MTKKKETAIDKVCRLMGGQTALVAALNKGKPDKDQISVQAVNKWVKLGRVPTERVIEVEVVCVLHSIDVNRYDMRPDIYGKAPPLFVGAAATAP